MAINMVIVMEATTQTTKAKITTRLGKFFQQTIQERK
jgi:hypothetical protein